MDAIFDPNINLPVIKADNVPNVPITSENTSIKGSVCTPVTTDIEATRVIAPLGEEKGYIPK